jgi:DNA-binding NarL/FixJ family response regulator
MDVSMGTLDGIEATTFITVIQPDTKVVMFTAWADPMLHKRALRAGAVAVILKDEEPEALAAAIRNAATA